MRTKIKLKQIVYKLLKIQYFINLEKLEYRRQKTIYGHFKNLISKWSRLIEKMTPIVFSECGSEQLVTNQASLDLYPVFLVHLLIQITWQDAVQAI